MIIEDIIMLLGKIPPGALDAVGHLITSVLSHDDPKRAAERAAAVIASEAVSDEAIRKALG